MHFNLQLMAEIFQDLLCNRDDYLRALRLLLREIMRAVRQDMNFPEFALGLMQERTDVQERTQVKFRDMDPQLKVSACDDNNVCNMFKVT